MKESDSEIDLFESITDEKEEKSIAVPKKVQSFEQFKECNDKASIPETFLLTGYELIQTEEEVRTNIMQEYIRGGSKNNSTGKKGKCVLELYDSILRYQLNRKDWQKFKYHVNKASRIQELLRRVLKEVFDASVVLETIQQDFEVHVNYIFKCEAEDIGQVVAKAIGEEAEQLIEFATLAMCRHISKEMFEAFIQDQQDSKKREIESFISQLTIDEKYQHFKGTNNPNPEKAFSSSLGINHKEKSSTCSNKARKKSKKQRNKSLFESLKDNTNQLENGKSLPQFIENRSQNHRFIHKEPEKNKIDISDPLEIEDLSVSDKYMDFPKVKKRKNLQNEHDPKMIPSQNLDDHTEVGDSEDSQLGKRLNPSIIPQKSQKHTSKEEINLEEEMNRGSKYFSSSDQNNSKVISQHHDSSKNRSKESISIQVVNSNNEKKRGVISDLHESVEESGLKPSTKYERFPCRKNNFEQFHSKYDESDQMVNHSKKEIPCNPKKSKISVEKSDDEVICYNSSTDRAIVDREGLEKSKTNPKEKSGSNFVRNEMNEDRNRIRNERPMNQDYISKIQYQNKKLAQQQRMEENQQSKCNGIVRFTSNRNSKIVDECQGPKLSHTPHLVIDQRTNSEKFNYNRYQNNLDGSWKGNNQKLQYKSRREKYQENNDSKSNSNLDFLTVNDFNEISRDKNQRKDRNHISSTDNHTDTTNPHHRNTRIVRPVHIPSHSNQAHRDRNNVYDHREITPYSRKPVGEKENKRGRGSGDKDFKMNNRYDNNYMEEDKRRDLVISRKAREIRVEKDIRYNQENQEEMFKKLDAQISIKPELIKKRKSML